MNRPLVVLTVSYAAGILIGGFAVIKASTALALAAFCFLAALVWYVRGWRGGRLVIVVLFVLTGLAASRLWLAGSETALLDYEGRRVTVTGWVAAEPDVREDRVFYLVKAREVSAGGERREISGTVRLVEKDPEQVRGYGDMLRATGLISRPASSGNPGLFDYRTYLERQGIKVTLFCRGRGAVERTGEYSANPLLKAVLTLKQRLAAGAAAGLPPAWARIVNGIVFGIQGPIDRDTRRAFSETGLVHVTQAVL
ncbi:MAG TPA: ComEC/Rec2 family competence protein [Bacillota bacterium]|nr:ComEC/Rec2 family competence protein [Bacillota bacterium]